MSRFLERAPVGGRTAVGGPDVEHPAPVRTKKETYWPVRWHDHLKEPIKPVCRSVCASGRSRRRGGGRGAVGDNAEATIAL